VLLAQRQHRFARGNQPTWGVVLLQTQRQRTLQTRQQLIEASSEGIATTHGQSGSRSVLTHHRVRG
jgi:hypothetical protein